MSPHADVEPSRAAGNGLARSPIHQPGPQICPSECSLPQRCRCISKATGRDARRCRQPIAEHDTACVPRAP